MNKSTLLGFAGALVAVLLLKAAPVLAQSAPSVPKADSNAWVVPSNEAISRLLAERMKSNGVGIVVGVIEPGGRRIVTHGKSGARDGRPLDGDTVFQIGSVTKVFTGLLLADMVQRGEVGIEDPAAKYLPESVTMPQLGRPITLIDLSKHWSALPSMPTNYSLQAKPNPYAAYTVDQLYAFLSSYQLPREPGRQAYSNLGVALLGRLLARHAGMEYEALLQRRVLDPLKLTSTSIALTSDQKRRLAPGHDRFLAPVETWEMVSMPASGSLRSTANDLLDLLSYNLGEPETPLYPAMVYQRTPMRAIGWGGSTLGGERVYGHDGGKEGYRAAALFNPRTKTGVIVLMNARTDEQTMALARHLLFPASPLPPVVIAPARPKLAKLRADVLDAHAGDYLLESGEPIALGRADERLLLDTKGSGIFTMLATSDREFVSNTEDMDVTFEVDAQGRTTGFVLREGERKRRAKKTM